MKYYAGIGSRETPPNILKQMEEIAQHLNKKEYILRSGHANGADQAFALGTTRAQIWLPWRTFNIKDRINEHEYKIINANDTEAYDSLKFHPVGQNLPPSIKSLMARNYRQIIGVDEANSEFVVCWTKDGKDTGGTGQALRIATHYNIPIYNLYFPNKYKEVMDLCK